MSVQVSMTLVCAQLCQKHQPVQYGIKSGIIIFAQDTRLAKQPWQSNISCVAGVFAESDQRPHRVDTWKGCQHWQNLIYDGKLKLGRNALSCPVKMFSARLVSSWQSWLLHLVFVAVHRYSDLPRPDTQDKSGIQKKLERRITRGSNATFQHNDAATTIKHRSSVVWSSLFSIFLKSAQVNEKK